ncbi:DoxX family protein [Microlunatus speluncae]|uniref:DoxX family protein n=1 Tax=Microlunatus speluncae TaxID=2594267 RepID=UPI00126639AB|nr:DoxX family protein [Microlunatus speluncae]
MTTQTLSSAPTRVAFRGRSRARTIVTWVLQVVLAAEFVLAGVPKLTGDPIMVAMFDALGAGQWLRYVVGALEVAGAVGLLIPPLAGLAAIGLTALMLGAVVSSVTALGASPVVPLAVAVVAAVVIVLRRDRIVATVRAVRRYSDRAATRKAR